MRLSGLALRGAGAVLLAASLEACAPEPVVTAPAVADRVVVEKSKRSLRLMQNGKALRSYRVALGQDPIGHKQHQGDSRTPEGVYAIVSRKSESRFNLALFVNYPNDEDRRRAAARGVPPGGEIYVHGQPTGGVNPARLAQTGPDWTDGCIAVTNDEMREIWALVKDGTPIEIRP